MKLRRPAIVLAVSVAALAISWTVMAQSGGGFDVSFTNHDGGGGVSSGGPFVVKGAAGQAATATLTGGDFIVNGGLRSDGGPPIDDADGDGSQRAWTTAQESPTQVRRTSMATATATSAFIPPR